MIRSALSLIKLADPVRYRRVQKQISNILIYPLPVLAAWSRPGRMCLIDASRIAADENENVGFMKRIAAAIVGRATVGYISGRYRKGGRDVVARIWRLCDEEERRFLLRVRQWEKGLGVEHVGAGEMSMAEFDVETGE